MNGSLSNPLVLPEFAEGVHYRQLRGGRYRFELLADVSIKIPCMAGASDSISFRDCKNVEWARIDGDTLTGRTPYAWNGASPCWWVNLGICGFWAGTPTPYPVVMATLYHDICFQFLRTYHWPRQLSFSACNELFRDIMIQQGFRLANAYYGAVTDFGQFFAGDYPRRGEFSQIVLTPPKP